MKMMYKNLFFLKNDLRNILYIYKKSINNVGVNNLYYPFIFDSGKKLQKTIGLWNISLHLKKFRRGAHMSRIFFFLEKYKNIPINIKSFIKIYKLLMYKLESNNISIQVVFMYFLKKISPISKNISFMNYKISFLFKRINIQNIFFLKIIIPVISLCPCSKNISNYNAHNQRSNIHIYLNLKKKINLNEIIHYIENEASSEIWSLLKRDDEKYITEFSYNNPKFVEDVIRNILFKIKKKNLNSFLIKIENFESIHNHNVYSLLNI